MADSASFAADPRYAGCDQITTVGTGVLNSRRAFRAQSQLVWAVQGAGRAYLQRRPGSAPGPDATPWQRLQSAYGRIRVPIPEGHAARSRVARLEVGDAADLIYIGVEDLDAGGLGSKFVVAFSERPAAVENLPSLASLPDHSWQPAVLPTDQALRWLGPPAESIEALAVQASLMSINRSKAFDRQLGVAPDQTGKGRRLYMALDLRIDRLADWPHTPDEPLVAYHRTDLLQPDSGSHLHQLLLAPVASQQVLCRAVVHIVRIGPRQDTARPWGTITAAGVATKPQRLDGLFFYPALDFVA
ncbi:MAG: hypothetical protein J4F42_00920 [Desulfurellaceae bacterium]|nr:hypothetical protein [Desulfurellaceae bacterium]